MPTITEMNSLPQQTIDRILSSWASSDATPGMRSFVTASGGPVSAWNSATYQDLWNRLNEVSKYGTSVAYANPSAYQTGSGGEGFHHAQPTPDQNILWALNAAQQQDKTLNYGEPPSYTYRNDLADAALSFQPYDIAAQYVAGLGMDPSQLRTFNHPAFGKVVLIGDLPQVEQTTGEEFKEALSAAAMIGAGALGISGFAGLHGLPGIDSLLGGFTGGGASDPLLGGFDTWTPEAISGYLSAPSNTFAGALQDVAQSQGRSMADLISSAWTENGVPMSPAEAQAYIDAGGTGIGATSGGGGFWDSVRNLFSNGSGSTVSGVSPSLSGLLSGGLQAAGGFLSGQSATNAARTAADSYVEAAKIAADAAKFRPVGVTTNFGSSRFTYGPDGNLASAGYSLSPQIKAQQDSLMGVSNNALTQYTNAQNATAPMGQTAQTLFGLGQGYLGTTPQEQAARYMEEQQALLAPYRERDFANLENRLLSQGRLGLATGATSTGLGAANPEMEAFYNAQMMQDLKLASEATKGGMDYTRFGAGLVGTGGDLLNSMYQTQTNAYTPYRTAIGGASMLEGLGQNAMDLGINIGAKGTAANAQSGQLLAQGMQQAAQTMLPANSYSPWGALLSGAGSALQNYQNTNQQQYRFDPYSGQQIRWGA